MVMATLELTDEQIVELIKQVPAGRRRTMLIALAEEAPLDWEALYAEGDKEMRRISAARSR